MKPAQTIPKFLCRSAVFALLSGAYLIHAPQRAHADEASARAKIESSAAEVKQLQGTLDAARKNSRTYDQKTALARLLDTLPGRASAYEELKQWPQAERVWDDAITYAREYDKLPNDFKYGMAPLLVSKAYNQYKQRKYSEAAATLRSARSEEGWNGSRVRGWLITQRVNLCLEKYDEVFSNATDVKMAIKEFRVRGGQPTLFQGDEISTLRQEAVAHYLKGDMNQTLSSWAEAAKVAGSPPDKHPFDPDQVPLNLAVASRPNDAAARLARARYLLRRGNQKVSERDGLSSSAFLDAPIGGTAKPAPALNTGGVTNLMELLTPISASFFESAVFDTDRGLEIAPNGVTPEDRAALYILRATARTAFNENTADSSRKHPQVQIYRDYQSATLSAPKNPGILRTAGEFFRAEAVKQNTPEAKSNMAHNAIGLYSRALYWAPNDTASTETRKQRQQLMPLMQTGKLEKVPEGEPKTAVEWKERGNAFHVAADWKNAFACYNKSIQVDPKFADGYNNIGNVYESIRHYDLAVEAYGRAIALDPKHRVAYHNRSQVWNTLVEPEKAMADANSAIQFAITPAAKRDALVWRADLNWTAGKDSEAIPDLLAATKLNPEKDAKGANPWIMLGTIQMKARDLASAEASFAKGLEFNPMHARALLMQGLLVHLTKSPKASELGPESRAIAGQAGLLSGEDDLSWFARFCNTLMKLAPYVEADAQAGEKGRTSLACRVYFAAADAAKLNVPAAQ